MHKNIHVHLYKITIEYTRTLLYNTVRNKENKGIKERLEEGEVMVKLGQTTRGTNHGCKYLWLVKNMQVYRNYDKKACYEVLAFNCNGWFVLYSGTLVDCKKFIGNEKIVESLEEDTKRQEKEVSTVETSEIEEAAETAETAEAEETKGKKTEESTASEETHLTETTGSVKRKADNQAYNSMCYNCKKFLNGCRGEKNKIYSGCVYKEKMEVRNNG